MRRPAPASSDPCRAATGQDRTGQDRTGPRSDGARPRDRPFSAPSTVRAMRSRPTSRSRMGTSIGTVAAAMVPLDWPWPAWLRNLRHRAPIISPPGTDIAPCGHGTACLVPDPAIQARFLHRPERSRAAWPRFRHRPSAPRASDPRPGSRGLASVERAFYPGDHDRYRRWRRSTRRRPPSEWSCDRRPPPRGHRGADRAPSPLDAVDPPLRREEDGHRRRPAPPPSPTRSAMIPR